MKTSHIIVLLAVVTGALAPRAAGQELDRYIWEVPLISVVRNDQTAPLLQKLDQHVAQMVEAGHLAPLWYPYTEGAPLYYWLNASDTLRALSQTIPFLEPARAQQIKAYLKEEIAQHGLRPLSLTQGTRREAYPPSKDIGRGRTPGNESLRQRSYLYGVWSYAHYTGDWETAVALLPEMLRIVDSIQDRSYEAISNHIGVLRVARHAGRQDVVDRLLPRTRQLLADGRDFTAWATEYNRRYNTMLRLPNTIYISTCGILIDLSPEMGRFLADHAREPVGQFIARQEQRVPLWFIARGPGHVGMKDSIYGRPKEQGQDQDEISSAPPYTSGPIFYARTMILGDSPQVMSTYLDVPQCRVGDLEYLQKLTALLRSFSQVKWTAP